MLKIFTCIGKLFLISQHLMSVIYKLKNHLTIFSLQNQLDWLIYLWGGQNWRWYFRNERN